jgi:hypothetical protein
MTNSSRNVLITIIVILLALNFRDPIRSFISKFNVTQQTPIVEKIPEKEDVTNNQFPFSALEYDVNLGSNQLPENIVDDKTSLFKVKCKITKDLDKFNVNYQVQYLGKTPCGLCLFPSDDTTKSESSYTYEFTQFENMQTLEFNSQIVNINQMKTTKPFIFFLQENDKVKTFNFMSLDDVSVPF